MANEGSASLAKGMIREAGQIENKHITAVSSHQGEPDLLGARPQVLEGSIVGCVCRHSTPTEPDGLDQEARLHWVYHDVWRGGQ